MRTFLSKNSCIIFFFAVLAMGAVSSEMRGLYETEFTMDAVHANNDYDTVTMTMTSYKFGNLKINLRGSGPLTIDWGDGAIESRRLTPGILAYSHHYNNGTRRTIIIYGQNITHLTCEGCRLTGLDISNNTELKFLHCARNRLTHLDVGKNIALTNLVCDNNQLTVLDLSANTALTVLHCSNNELKSLDVNKNRSLTNLICEGNFLTGLYASNTEALMLLNCRKNKLSAEALNTLFNVLNATKEEGKLLYIRNNPGTGACNQTIATDKHWKIDTSFI